MSGPRSEIKRVTVRPMVAAKKAVAPPKMTTPAQLVDFAIEHAQDNAFAELRGQGRDAQIDHAAGDVLLDAAILREAALGDVELRHDLDARGDGVLELHRRLHDLVEHAVHAEAHAETLLVRFEMDIRGAALDLDHDAIAAPLEHPNASGEPIQATLPSMLPRPRRR